MKRFLAALGVVVLAGLFLSPESFAAGAGLPYESAMTTLKTSLTGPVATGIAIIGICVAGGVLIFGGDLNGFFRTMCLIVLVAALLVCSTKILEAFYSDASGAVVAAIPLMLFGVFGKTAARKERTSSVGGGAK
ncbi:putative conjugal transfer protein TrbC [Planctomycetales bacterium]|nr:putative conjugal transfer protein TrbC [Planctomycetales bacterium]GHS99023.1 putative conjugal transfer protein TrbC [Planctomycetales bacterium]GHT03712.1 putative conjugal transfer protein TrbC [Planctomycetales bacterium]